MSFFFVFIISLVTPLLIFCLVRACRSSHKVVNSKHPYIAVKVSRISGRKGVSGPLKNRTIMHKTHDQCHDMSAQALMQTSLNPQG